MPNYSDPVDAAMRKVTLGGYHPSFFPAARMSERSDLLKDAEDAFYGGGQAQPSPTPKPTPTPAPRLFLTGNNFTPRFQNVPFQGPMPSLIGGAPKPSGFSFVPRISIEQLALPPSRRPLYYNEPRQFDVYPNYKF